MRSRPAVLCGHLSTFGTITGTKRFSMAPQVRRWMNIAMGRGAHSHILAVGQSSPVIHPQNYDRGWIPACGTCLLSRGLSGTEPSAVPDANLQLCPCTSQGSLTQLTQYPEIHPVLHE